MRSRLIIVIAIIVALFAIACNSTPAKDSTSDTSSSSQSSAGQTAAVPTSTPPKPTVVPTSTPAKSTGGSSIGDGDIKSMATAWGNAKSYRVKIEGTTEGHAFNMLEEYVKPDREHVKIDGFLGSGTIEMYNIGQDSYSNMTGQWTKSPSTGSLGVGFDPDQFISDMNASIASGDSITKGAKTNVNGVDCQEWIIQSTVPEDSGSMYIGISDNLPRMFKSADGRMTMTFTDWNASITINPPPM